MMLVVGRPGVPADRHRASLLAFFNYESLEFLAAASPGIYPDDTHCLQFACQNQVTSIEQYVNVPSSNACLYEGDFEKF
jgi:hypothetical protein